MLDPWALHPSHQYTFAIVILSLLQLTQDMNIQNHPFCAKILSSLLIETEYNSMSNVISRYAMNTPLKGTCVTMHSNVKRSPCVCYLPGPFKMDVVTHSWSL